MVNVLQAIFFLKSFLIVLIGAFVNWLGDYLPAVILKSYKYGKFAYKGKAPTLQVPKRWFRHFYVFSSIWSTMSTCLMLHVYIRKREFPSIAEYLSIFGTETGTVPATVSLFAMVLLTIQCWKRFYETHFVSVFSDAKMDFSHYLIGFFHYFGCVLAILCEAPGIINPSEPHELSFSDIQLSHLLLGVFFLWASKSQLECATILANLRKDTSGKVITTKYRIPRGGYFYLVSCPHQLFEIVMYLCLLVILWGNRTWPFVTLWVVTNQVETALLSHWWYQETFKNYPKKRKALIPFIL